MITALDKNTALVLIDLQNSIISSTATAHPVDSVLGNANKLVDAFRNKNLPVVFVNVKPKKSFLNLRKDIKTSSFPDDENLFKLSNKLHTKESDIYITKTTWGAFFETPLHDELKKRNITGIVLAGISTSIGVEGTGRSAIELGYNVSFALDAMTDRATEAHDRSVQNIFPRIGESGSTNDIIDMLNK